MTSIPCNDNAPLRNSNHITELMGEYFDTTPNKLNFGVFHRANYSESPKVYSLSVFNPIS